MWWLGYFEWQHLSPHTTSSITLFILSLFVARHLQVGHPDWQPNSSSVDYILWLSAMFAQDWCAVLFQACPPNPLPSKHLRNTRKMTKRFVSIIPFQKRLSIKTCLSLTTHDMNSWRKDICITLGFRTLMLVRAATTLRAANSLPRSWAYALPPRLGHYLPLVGLFLADCLFLRLVWRKPHESRYARLSL